ncbi:MAG TPA: DUF2188 domain-containing protein [Candidatus Dormibacteraeota bacterium]|nr:DUF2188 domain-containing protein [Candidatus Dormibacteraeota bacterium]
MTFKTLPSPAKSNKQVQEYVNAVEKGRNSYFVVQNGKGWYVRKASVRTSPGKLFPTKSAAISNAQARAVRRNSKVLVFDRDGSFHSSLSED